MHTQYDIVIGPSWAIAKASWAGGEPKRPFVGLRVERGQVYVLCDVSKSFVTVSAPIVEAVQRAFEVADPLAWCLDGVFIAEMPCIAAGHRLARRVVEILAATYDGS